MKVGLDILGLLLAMIGDSDWETESATRIATYLTTSAFVHLGHEAGTDLMAYVSAFQIREASARGKDIKIITDIARKQFGDEILEKTASKLEEIENVRKKRRNKK